MNIRYEYERFGKRCEGIYTPTNYYLTNEQIIEELKVKEMTTKVRLVFN